MNRGENMGMKEIIYAALLGIVIGFVARIYQASGRDAFVGTLLGSMVVLPIIYFTAIFGVIPAFYFAIKKKEFLIEQIVRFSRTSDKRESDISEEEIKDVLNKHWIRTCASIVHVLWSSMDTISCITIEAIAQSSREVHPIANLKGVFRKTLHDYRDQFVHAMNAQLVKRQDAKL